MKLKKRRKLSDFIQLRLRILRAYTNDVETIIAFSPEDAIKAWEEWSGDKWDDSYDPYDRAIPYFKRFTVRCEPDDFDEMLRTRPPFSKIELTYPHAPAITAPMWAWIWSNGRGFFASTEF